MVKNWEVKIITVCVETLEIFSHLTAVLHILKTIYYSINILMWVTTDGKKGRKPPVGTKCYTDQTAYEAAIEESVAEFNPSVPSDQKVNLYEMVSG